MGTNCRTFSGYRLWWGGDRKKFHRRRRGSTWNVVEVARRASNLRPLTVAFSNSPCMTRDYQSFISAGLIPCRLTSVLQVIGKKTLDLEVLEASNRIVWMRNVYRFVYFSLFEDLKFVKIILHLIIIRILVTEIIRYMKKVDKIYDKFSSTKFMRKDQIKLRDVLEQLSFSKKLRSKFIFFLYIVQIIFLYF